MVSHLNNLTYFFLNIDKTLNIREKSQKNRGGIPPKNLIRQQPKNTESLNWYQMIAMVMFYNHKIRFMKN